MDWVTAKDLREALGVHRRVGSSGGPTMMAVRQRAGAGVMAAQATLLTIGEDRSENCAVPIELWSGAPLDLSQNWNTGDFRRMTDPVMAAFGVVFSKDDAIAMGANFTATPSCNPTRKGRGRRPNVGGYKAFDSPLIDEMRTLIDSGESASPWKAAEKVVERAKGSPEIGAREKRLVRGYYKRFPE
jgi:hypothetical protein